ncbi:hypothetical protein [Algoriphagus zhangzhouensis]|uniref:Uncharacterized protein n=1 Tax=Algoriphagus zhangzhouensis TaxID=1073327 RepID=A0A1M7ZJ98_9BACT|nr:hypothetical protein [Algoriphagus zhangzhouensis]TDY43742.1 hypothetical protein A8938_3842 [Algoriphagus zhangzhouensis]SHO64736.1 hypothetical protein SAMN04488108_3619 [Algoriphagus zhangzhouensis]
MKAIISTLLIFAGISAYAQTAPSKDIQIVMALLAAPEDQRENATVYGYDTDGDIILLRQGSNQTVCLGDDPNREGLSVASYHISAQPFMTRGWELKKEGNTFQEIFDIREAESKDGKLQLPDQGSVLNALTADEADVNWATGEANNTYTRSVIYIPWATAESTGLPLSPAGPGLPWIMNPGTHRAHIMINPARD